jgi:hypothetical protein
MSWCVMAALAKKRHLSNQELGMVTSMNLVAVQAVLRNRGMFIGIRSPLFCMALITKIIH